MTKVMLHQCKTCGGSLKIDEVKQLYICTNCGNTYDYEYFKEDDVHKKGYRFLEAGEFIAARDAFSFSLQKIRLTLCRFAELCLVQDILSL